MPDSICGGLTESLIGLGPDTMRVIRSSCPTNNDNNNNVILQIFSDGLLCIRHYAFTDMMSLYSRVSQSWYYWPFGPEDFLLWGGGILCILKSSIPGFDPQTPVSRPLPPGVTAKTISRHYLMSPGGKKKNHPSCHEPLFHLLNTSSRLVLLD